LSPSITPTFGSLSEKPMSVFNDRMNAKSASAIITDRSAPNLVRKVFKLAIKLYLFFH